MNRAVLKMVNRRCALKSRNRNMYGGGLAVNSLAPYTSSNGVPIESRVHTEECYDTLRPGEIRAEPNPALAQVAMAGGKYGGANVASPISMVGRGRKTRKQRGGNKGGFGVDPSFNVGGEGPNAAPANIPVPCDARAGSMNPTSVSGMLNPDHRAYGVGYSATVNQTAPVGQAGGAYVDTRIANFDYAVTQAGGNYGGNAYDASCYRAPGSSMPVYPAQSVGFNFSPSTAAGAAYSDGVTPFNEVNQVVARTGGARRSYRKRKVNRKSRKGKKNYRKANRK
jgi:hypothetical protein